ncbi:nucleoside transporter C-terminal domain-containing protein [Georgenia sp. 10Sc9-8]|uniref:Nucleoside transporter C-terminal domain-containing protein n=1 Tax=Georgenia halotolerans TaxID=3028317 RepID=A0ABT5TY04_9MICO|nr:nucleoside transporter C-terminal domain-containing protein [Georgenia halotolerans]
MLDVLWGVGGMIVILSIAVLLSVDRRKIRVRTVGLALAIQVLFGVLVLYFPPGQTALAAVTRGVQAVIDSSAAGIDFLFGPILPEEGSVFAFQVLPVIVFFAALTAVLYYINVLQWIVKIIGGGLSKLLGTSTPESMNAAANIFVGQTEAPLVIRPYIKGMTRSELFAIMVGGLSTVAGSVLVGYSLLGARLDYLIAASFMAAPAALLMAKLLVPTGALQDAEPATVSAGPAQQAGDGTTPAASAASPAHPLPSGEAGPMRRRGPVGWILRGGQRGASAEAAAELARRANVPDETGPDDEEDGAEVEEPRKPANVIDAAAQGASDGMGLALNVGAMLIAFISLIALVNLVLGVAGGLFGQEDLTLEVLLGYLFSPIMLAVGVPWAEALDGGSFLGQKIVLNEFVAFSNFAPQLEEYTAKTQAVVTFALTGFANFASLAILLGGLGGLAPDRRSDIARLGLRAVLGGTLANLMSAAIAGMLIG